MENTSNHNKHELLMAWERRYANAPPLKDPRIVDFSHNTAGGHGLVRSRDFVNGNATTQDIDQIVKQAGKDPEDRKRAELLKNTMLAGFRYGQATEENRMGGNSKELKVAQDQYWDHMKALIAYDKEHKHPLGDPTRNLKKDPYTFEEQRQWLGRGQKIATHEETVWKNDFRTHMGPNPETAPQANSRSNTFRMPSQAEPSIARETVQVPPAPQVSVDRFSLSERLAVRDAIRSGRDPAQVMTKEAPQQQPAQGEQKAPEASKAKEVIQSQAQDQVKQAALEMVGSPTVVPFPKVIPNKGNIEKAGQEQAGKEQAGQAKATPTPHQPSPPSLHRAASRAAGGRGHERDGIDR